MGVMDILFNKSMHLQFFYF